MFRAWGVLEILLIGAVVLIESKNHPRVEYLSVVFRHGHRAPLNDGNEFYPNDPNKWHNYSPPGYGMLTKKGEQREYDLGAYLRGRYGSDFIGSYKKQAQNIDARSTNRRRTIQSLKKVLDGLYGKSRTWTQHISEGTFSLHGKTNRYRKYHDELDRVKISKGVTARIGSYQRLMNWLSFYTGKSIRDPTDMANLYHTLAAEESMGLQLPPWTKQVYGNGVLKHAAAVSYEIDNWNDKLKKLNVGGSALKRIYNDMDKHTQGKPKKAARINLFSGHETTVAAFLLTLGIYESHIPNYGSAVIVELRLIQGKYYVKILYYDGKAGHSKVKTIPNCDELCPLGRFKNLLNHVMPTNEDLK